MDPSSIRIPDSPPAMASAFCNHCQNIAEGFWKASFPAPPPHYATFQEVVASAEAGCAICSLLIPRPGELEASQRKDFVNSDYKMLLKRNTFEKPYPRLVPCVIDNLRQSLCFFESREPKELSPKAPFPMSNATDRLELAKHWYDFCDSTHSSCKTRVYCPTRILGLGSSTIQLIHSYQLPQAIKYATLSHCWGGPQQFKLQKANIQEFQKEIPQSQLCKTFVDAIKVTKKLGLEYLWIDTLCIIQDDTADWERESSKMADVYGCSSINIAATSAANGSVGCFLDQPVTSRPNKMIKFYRIKPHNKRVFCCTRADLMDVLENGPLARRAWAFQERFLAPRTLHFADSQIFWECGSQFACDTFKEVVPQPFRHEILTTKEAVSKERLWNGVVDIYSNGCLTVATDRLVAMSGVVKWLETTIQDECLAGLWRSCFERGLCWYRSHTTTYTSPAEYIAPSWSWASLNAPVGIAAYLWDAPSENAKLADLVEVQEVSLSPINPGNLSGQLKGGVLKLLFNQIICVRQGSDEREMVIVRTSKILRCHISWDMGPGQRDLLYLLPILKETRPTTNVRGVMLELEAGSAERRFRRVGYFQTINFDPDLHPDPNPEFEKNGERYIITII